VTLTTVGVDLGGTNLRVGVVDGAGTVLGERRLPTPHELDDIIDAIGDCVRELARDHPDARGVGIGAAGMVDFDGVIRFSPNLPAFRDTPMAGLVRDAVGMPVVLDNDANVTALAEVTHGAARGRKEVLCITLGTGVGGGIVSRGRVLRGANGFAAEIGHFQVDPDGPVCACGERGHWEAVASGSALGAIGRARAATGDAPAVLALAGGDASTVTGVHVGDAARTGAADALAILAEYARNVAVGLVGLVNILDPELVVVGGGLVDLGDALFGPLCSFFQRHLEGATHRPAVTIVPAALGERAGVVGAAVLARELAAS
jgi:glucokinase